MSKCGVCLQNVPSRSAKLTCSDCAKCFHVSCLNMSKTDLDCITSEGLVWRCEPCATERRRSMRLDCKSAEGKVTLEDLMTKIVEITNTFKQVESNFNTAHEALNQKMEENTKALLEQTNENKKFREMIESVVTENTALKKKVLDLEARLEEMEQYSRSNALEIHGVPHDKNEDVLTVVKKVGKGLGMEITDSLP